MFKTVLDRVWAFDCEWAPDPVSGRMLYGLPDSMSDRDVVKEMWIRNGATEEVPQPFLKMALCRLVSIVFVDRTADKQGNVKLLLHSLPKDTTDEVQCREASIISAFLNGIGRSHPQLVGYNSRGSDLKILVQRGLALGIQASGFCARPDKPWEGVDYFARESNSNVDLAEVIGGWGRDMPSLNQIATVSGIPGKLDATGDDVAGWWLDGRLSEIIAYNQFDALTTYLLWLRLAHFAGHFTASQYEAEQGYVRELLERLLSTGANAHLTKYLEAWDRLKSMRS